MQGLPEVLLRAKLIVLGQILHEKVRSISAECCYGCNDRIELNHISYKDSFSYNIMVVNIGIHSEYPKVFALVGWVDRTNQGHHPTIQKQHVGYIQRNS